MKEENSYIKALLTPSMEVYQNCNNQKESHQELLHKLAPLVKPLPLKMIILSLSDKVLKELSNSVTTFEEYKSIQTCFMEILISDLKPELEAFDSEQKAQKQTIKDELQKLAELVPESEDIKTFSEAILQELDHSDTIKLPKNITRTIQDKDIPAAIKVAELKKLANEVPAGCITFNMDKVRYYENLLNKNQAIENTLQTIYELLLNIKYGLSTKINAEIMYGLSWCNDRCLKLSSVLQSLVVKRSLLYSDIYRSLPEEIQQLIFRPYVEDYPTALMGNKEKLSESAISNTRKQIRGTDSPMERKRILGAYTPFPNSSNPRFLILLAKLRNIIRYYLAENISLDIRTISQNSPVPATSPIRIHLAIIWKITKESQIFNDTYATKSLEKQNHSTSFNIFKDKFGFKNNEIADALGMSPSKFSKLKEKDDPSLYMKLALLYDFTYDFFAGSTTIPDYGKYEADLLSIFVDGQSNSAINIDYKLSVINSIMNGEHLIENILLAFGNYILSSKTIVTFTSFSNKYQPLINFLFTLYNHASDIKQEDLQAITHLLKFNDKK